MISVLARFSRPHTIIATTVQVVTLFMIAGGLRYPAAEGLPLLLITWISCLALNIYIVGLNQISDVAIDEINKPYLPLASRELSMRRGRLIVTAMALLALVTAWMGGPYLLLTVGIIMVIGTAYSLPPLHLKRHALWAALSIALARGAVANIGVALHYHQTFGGLSQISPLALAALAAFFFAFGVVIAIYKDIPDLVGDRIHEIGTLTVRLGPYRVFNLGRLILTAGYLGLMAVALTRLPHPDGVLLLAAHGLLLALFWWASSRVDPAQRASITRFYMFLWLLFYAEYGVLGLYSLSMTVT